MRGDGQSSVGSLSVDAFELILRRALQDMRAALPSDGNLRKSLRERVPSEFADSVGESVGTGGVTSCGGSAGKSSAVSRPGKNLIRSC